MHSYAQSSDFTCPQCGQSFSAEVWLVIDVRERPDLTARARTGDLHAVACPRCGPLGRVDAPLLVYLPDANPATGQPPLIFSPAQQSSAEQDQEQAGGLLGQLAGQLGDTWQDDWLAQVATVRRDLLPAALSDDPAAAMHELLAEEGALEPDAMPPALEEALIAMVATLAAEGVTVDSAEALERILADRPDLRARLEAAWQEVAAAATPAGDPPASLSAPGQVEGEQADGLPDLLQRFLAAETWDESQRIVEAHPELLSAAAERHLSLALEEAAGTPGATHFLATHRALLRRCRAAGIARAFAEQILGAEGMAEAERRGLLPEEFLAEQVPPALLGQALIAEITQMTQRTDMPRRIEVCRQALTRIDRSTDPRWWAALQVELANSYAQSLQGDKAANIERAIEGYELALQVLTRQAMPIEWATAQMNLANAYSDRIRGDKAANIERAIEGYELALQVRTRQAMPIEFLAVQRSLARTMAAQARFNQSMAHAQEALSVAEELYEASPTPDARRNVLADVQGVPHWFAYACCRHSGSDGLRQAVTVIEQYRARWVREALERSSTRPADLSAALWLDFQAQAQAVRELEAEWRLPDQTPGRRSFSQLSADLDRARHTLRQTVTAVRAEVPNFLPRPTFDQILAAAQPGPLIYLLATEAGGLALIVHGASTASPVEALWLDTLHSAGIDAILYDREDESQGRYLRGAVGADPVALADSLAQALPLLGERLAQPLAARLAAICPAGTPVTLIASSTLGLLPLHAAPVTLAGRTAPFMDFFAVRYAPSATVLHQATRRADQAAALRVAGVGNPLSSLETGRWAQGQVATLLPALQAIDATRHLAPLPGDDPAAAAQRAVLLARWQRTLVRLAAMATMEASDLVRTGRLYVDLLSLLPLFDEEEWLPHLSSLLALAQRLPPSLEAAEAEAYSVRDLAGAQRSDLLFTHAATAPALWQRLPGATWLHLACHGRFDVREPLDSALWLAEDTQITLRALLAPEAAAALSAVRLAFLSACQSAITDFRTLDDEVIGLPAGFLQAGIPAVIGTLWPVNDRSTALLVTRFYELLLHGDTAGGLPPQRPIHALHQAQQWLRTVDNAALAAYLDRHQELMAAPAGEENRMSWLLIRDERRRVRNAIEQGNRQDRPYQAPYHWAAFAYFGADLDPIA